MNMMAERAAPHADLQLAERLDKRIDRQRAHERTEPAGTGGLGKCFFVADLYVCQVVRRVASQPGLLPSRHDAHYARRLRGPLFPHLSPCESLSPFLFPFFARSPCRLRNEALLACLCGFPLLVDGKATDQA